MKRPDSVRCENCIFADGKQWDNFVICKRYPPQQHVQEFNVNLTNNGGSMSGQISPFNYTNNLVSPQMSKMDWCGEFVPSDNLTAVEWVAWKKGLLQNDSVPS